MGTAIEDEGERNALVEGRNNLMAQLAASFFGMDANQTENSKLLVESAKCNHANGCCCMSNDLLLGGVNRSKV